MNECVYSGLRVPCVMTQRQFNTILLFVLLLYFLLIKTQDRTHTHFQQHFCTNSATEVSTGHNQSAGPTFVFLLLSYNIHKEHLFLINHYCPSCDFSASCRALSSLQPFSSWLMRVSSFSFFTGYRGGKGLPLYSRTAILALSRFSLLGTRAMRV